MHGPTARRWCRILADEDAAAAAARLRACTLPPEAAASGGAAAGAAAGDTLVAFLACWAEHATDTRGPFQMRLCAAVLARLLAGKIAEVSQAQVRRRRPTPQHRTAPQGAAVGPFWCMPRCRDLVLRVHIRHAFGCSDRPSCYSLGEHMFHRRLAIPVARRCGVPG